MPFKGIFKNNNQKSQAPELEKAILRINALEVQIKELVKFEKQVRTTLFGNEGISGSSLSEGKYKSGLKNQRSSQQMPYEKSSREMVSSERKLQELSQQGKRLEDQGNRFSQKRGASARASSAEEEQLREEQLFKKFERHFAQKWAVQVKREEAMQKKIQELEKQISALSHGSTPVHSKPYQKNSTKTRKYGGFSEAEYPQEEAEMETLYDQVNRRLLALEQNYVLINEVQAGLLRRVDELLEKWNEVTHEGDDGLPGQRDAIFRTLYIDKLYLDKYEQNNNFAQLGINHLSGALNIGATYGKDAIPKNITEDVKAEMEKMKKGKEEMENDQSSFGEQSNQSHEKTASAEETSDQTEEEIPFTDINIEDDFSFGEEPF